VVTSLTLSFTDDHLELQRVVLSNTPNLDHVDLASSMHWYLELGDEAFFASLSATKPVACRGA
jgi:hypothetical protein